MDSSEHRQSRPDVEIRHAIGTVRQQPVRDVRLPEYVEAARLLADVAERAIRMRDDDTHAPGWSVRQAAARVILGEVTP